MDTGREIVLQGNGGELLLPYAGDHYESGWIASEVVVMVSGMTVALSRGCWFIIVQSSIPAEVFLGRVETHLGNECVVLRRALFSSSQPYLVRS